MGVGERTAMEGPKQHFIGDASDVKEMKTNEDKTAASGLLVLRFQRFQPF